jgi:glycine betaine catabolism A
LIWTKLDPASDGSLDIAGYLGELNWDLNAIGLAHHRFYRQHAVRRATNWKLIVDAFLEVYHVRRLHSATLGPFFADAVSVSDAVGRHLKGFGCRPEHERSIRYKAGVRKPRKKEPAGKR